MPTHEELTRFLREWAKLTPQQQTLFLAAVEEMVEDLRTGVTFRPSLRVKGVQGQPGVYEMTWASDGRATFHYGVRGGATPWGAPHRLAPHRRARDPQEPVRRE
jgi:hypothetical protein